MDPRLQEMLDHYEIRKTLALCAHGCDRGDADLMGSTYTGEDSIDDHGHARVPGPEFAHLATELIRERTEAVWHLLGQTLVRIEDDTAVVETAFLALMRKLPDQAGRSHVNQLAGRYVDQLERLDGKWKIKNRTCIRDTSITLAVEKDEYAGVGFRAGTRDGNDLGVASLGMAHRA